MLVCSHVPFQELALSKSQQEIEYLAYIYDTNKRKRMYIIKNIDLMKYTFLAPKGKNREWWSLHRATCLEWTLAINHR
jgi:hypothetical protein